MLCTCCLPVLLPVPSASVGSSWVGEEGTPALVWEHIRREGHRGTSWKPEEQQGKPPGCSWDSIVPAELSPAHSI